MQSIVPVTSDTNRPEEWWVGVVVRPAGHVWNKTRLTPRERVHLHRVFADQKFVVVYDSPAQRAPVVSPAKRYEAAIGDLRTNLDLFPAAFRPHTNRRVSVMEVGEWARVKKEERA